MRRFVLAGLLLAASSQARADITIGALLSLTGPGAGLGIPEKNTIELLPKTIAGQAVRWVILDDASDTTAAVRAARKMVDEEKVDAIIGGVDDAQLDRDPGRGRGGGGSDRELGRVFGGDRAARGEPALGVQADPEREGGDGADRRAHGEDG